MKRLLPAALSILALSCGAKPWRFRDQPPVTRVLDDRPIPLPRIRVDPVDVLAVSDAFVRRPVAQALAPERIPRAGDVSSLDLVVESSWFGAKASDAEPDGPPELPFTVLFERTPTGERGLAVRDKRGRRYELRRDAADRPEMRTGAAAVAGRIARAVGYFVPEVHVVEGITEADFQIEWMPEGRDSIPDPGAPERKNYPDVARKVLDAFVAEAPTGTGGAFRVSAVRWPVGVDVGRTPEVDLRDDDANDTVPHENRRSLRALKVLAGWLGQNRFLPQAVRDVYVGASGKGHLVHMVTRFDGAFGGDAVIADKQEQKDELLLLVSLGFAPGPAVPPTQKRFLSMGAFGPLVELSKVAPGIPFIPMDRMMPADAFWMAARMAAVSRPMLERAVATGKYSDPAAARWLVRTLEERRLRLFEQIFKLATPASFEGVSGRALRFRDLAVHNGLVSGKRQEYLVAILDAQGNRIGRTFHTTTDPDGKFEIALGSDAWKKGYVVVRMQVLREGVSTAPMQVHARTDGQWGLRVIGIVR